MNVGALSLLFETAPGTIVHRHQLALADCVSLFAQGWLQNLPQATTSVCGACASPHHVAVAWDDVREELGCFCPDGGGWTAVNPDELQQFYFDHDRFLTALSKALGAAQPQPIIDGLCWRWGGVKRWSEVAVVVARGMNDPRSLVAIAEAVCLRFKRGPGVLLCGARPIVDLGLFPPGFGAATFETVLAVSESGEISIDTGAVLLVLGLGRGRGAHGAPVAHPKLMSYIAARLANGEALESDTAEAKQILSDPKPWATPTTTLPRIDALRMAIKRQRKSIA